MQSVMSSHALRLLVHAMVCPLALGPGFRPIFIHSWCALTWVGALWCFT